jgi:putative redox protein
VQLERVEIMAKEAVLNWTDGLQFVGRASEGPAVVLDNPEGGSGPSPMDLVLIGIAGCTGMDVISILRKKRTPFTGMRIHIQGDRAENHPRRYTRIGIEFVVYGSGVKAADVERSIQLSVTKYCGAIASVNAAVETSFRILEPASEG